MSSALDLLVLLAAVLGNLWKTASSSTLRLVRRGDGSVSAVYCFRRKNAKTNGLSQSVNECSSFPSPRPRRLARSGYPMHLWTVKPHFNCSISFAYEQENSTEGTFRRIRHIAAE